MKLFLSIAAGLAALSLAVAAGAYAQAPGDPAAGAAVFDQQCSKCHTVGPDAKNGVGPVLNGIIGRKAGSYPDFGYSPQNKNLAVKWDIATLTRYLKSPKSFVVGTKMFFDGLSSPRDIADLIAFLAQYDIAGKKQP